MFTAKAAARNDGCVTLAMMVFVGPVQKNRKKTVRNTKIHAVGNGRVINSRAVGTAINMPTPDTRKYDPGEAFPGRRR